MSLYSIYETNPVAEKQGHLVEVQDGDSVVGFMVARAGGANRKFSAMLQSEMRPHQNGGGINRVSEDAAQATLVRVMSYTLIKDWDGVTDREGNLVEFSPEECITLLTALPELRDMLYSSAQDISNFAVLEREEDAKK